MVKKMESWPGLRAHLQENEFIWGGSTSVYTEKHEQLQKTPAPPEVQQGDLHCATFYSIRYNTNTSMILTEVKMRSSQLNPECENLCRINGLICLHQ